MSGAASKVMSIFMSTFASTGCTKKEWRDACHEAGITSSGTFSRALNKLTSQPGPITNTGTDKRPYYKLGDLNA